MMKTWTEMRKGFRRVQSNIKTIFGMPNYDRYLKHWNAHHAGVECCPLSEREYYLHALRERYEKGGVNRCC